MAALVEGSAGVEYDQKTMNLAHIIDDHPAEAVALICRNRPITYGELRDRVAAMRGGLDRAGLQPGERLMIACANDHRFVVAYLAAIGIGAVVVPINPTSPAPELEREIAKVGPAMILIDAVSAPAWSALASSAASVRTVIATDPQAAERCDSPTMLIDELFDGEPAPIVEVEPSAIAAMLFTSGTAGAPRAAMLSHQNLLSNIEQSLSSPVHTESTDVVYGVLPLFHIFGLNVCVGVTLAAGATLVLVQRFDPAMAVETINDRGVTIVPGAPPMWIAFAHFEDLDADTFASVRLAVSGASRLPVSVSERIADRFGVRIAEGYGLTETSPVVTSSSALDELPRFGSVGKTLRDVEIRLVNDDGQDVPVGDAGEILVRGPNVFVGYFNDEEATNRVLRDGWLHTGDVGTVDDDGWLYLVDRAKDLIIVSGFNVFPAEVEEVLVSHPAIAEAGVVGVVHPHTGEAVRAYVVLEPGCDVDEDSVIDYACDHLARYKCPSKVLFVDELPRNVSGKLVRRHLGRTVLDNV
jgi:long-chain acyl-CoA synthetase